MYFVCVLGVGVHLAGSTCSRDWFTRRLDDWWARSISGDCRKLSLFLVRASELHARFFILKPDVERHRLRAGRGLSPPRPKGCDSGPNQMLWQSWTVRPTHFVATSLLQRKLPYALILRWCKRYCWSCSCAMTTVSARIRVEAKQGLCNCSI